MSDCGCGDEQETMKSGKKHPQFTGLEINLSDKCNLACGFCYTRKSCGNEANWDRTERSLRWFIKQCQPIYKEARKKRIQSWQANVTVYGGEPLVEWGQLQRLVEFCGMQKLPIKVSIVTNMTLLDTDKLHWLMQHAVTINCSIDGCPEAQDTHRIFPNGTGTSEIAILNARRWLAFQKESTRCRSTISPETAHLMFESIKYLCEDVGFQEVNQILAGGVEWDTDAIAVVKKEATKIVDWWIDMLRKGEHYSLYSVRNMLQHIWNPIRRTGLCSAGCSRIAVDTKGRLFPCHRFCNLSSKEEYQLGTIDIGITNLGLWAKIRDHNVLQSTYAHCVNCPAVLACNAQCIHDSMIGSRRFAEPSAHHCEVWKHYWKEALRAHAILTAENNKLYISYYRKNG